MIERRHIYIDGLRLSYLERGEASRGKPTLVLVHGLMGCADTFVAFMEALEPEVHVIALDLPGAGQSERRADIDARLASTADSVLLALDALHLEKPVMVGHSHGGAVAMSLAARYRDAVRSLVLLAPAHPYFDEGDPLIRFYLTLPGRLFAYSIPWYPKWMQLFALRRMAGSPTADGLKQLRPYRENLQTPGTIHHLLRLLRSWKKDFSKLHRALHRPLAIPTMIVWGDCDRAIPMHTAEMLRVRLTRSEMKVLPGVGHRPAEETPEVIASIVLDWLDRHDAVQVVHYSPKLSPIQARRASLNLSSLEAGD